MNAQLTRFQILKKITSNEVAEIFMAKRKQTLGAERLVFIKLLLDYLKRDRKFVQMFLKEARAAARLIHPNIVQIYDTGYDNGNYFIATEYIHGQNLAAIAQTCQKHQVALPPSLVSTIAFRVCQGLHYAHKKSDVSGKSLEIVHRDLRPQNIMISYSGEVKLLGFDLSKPIAWVRGSQKETAAPESCYLAPEQCKGQTADGRSDLFALGIILWELLTSQHLFFASSSSENFKKITSQLIDPPSSINPTIPKSLDNLIVRALAQHPKDRFQNAQEMQDALGELIEELDFNTSPSSLNQFLGQLFEEGLVRMQRIEKAQESGELESLLFDNIESPNEEIVPGIVTVSDPSLPKHAEIPTQFETQMPLVVRENKAGESFQPHPLEDILPTPESGSKNPHPVPAPKFSLGVTQRDFDPLETSSKTSSARSYFLWFVVLFSLGLGGFFLFEHFYGPIQTVPPSLEAQPPFSGVLEIDLGEGNEGTQPVWHSKGTLSIKSSPTGARIELNGRASGSTPRQIGELELGKTYLLHVHKSGYEDFRTDVTLNEKHPVAKFDITLKQSN